MPNPVVHWEIGAKDAPKLWNFYGQLFGWKIEGDNPQHYGLVQTETPDQGINGGIGMTSMGSYITFYVLVDDLQAYLNKAEKLGGTTLMPPTPIENVGSFALFKDPEGNCIGLWKQKA